MENPNQITFFGETDARNKRLRFGIKAKDRSRHVYVIGKTGMGKSTLLENLAIQDIQNGNGLAFVDPHGKTADLLLEYVPEHRIKDVLYFAPFDMEHPVSFNVMEDVGYDKRHLVAAGLMSSFKKIWVDAWSARMEYILNNILLALLEYPDATLIGVNRMLADKDYRKKVVDNITDPAVKAFWNDEFAKYGERYMQEAGAAIQNKIGQFISNPLIRNIIGQPKSTFDIRELMDQKKILIINLSKGRMGEANANLLGGMLITKIYLGAMSRADVTDDDLKKLPSFYLFVDEFQNFANESFADILSEARKYKLALTVAHQYIEQMTDEVRAAVFGNVGTMISFRVGSYDAEVLEKEFAPEFIKDDIVNLGRFQMYLRLMIDEVGSKPFSAVGMSPIQKPAQTYVREIIDNSRATYAQPRAKVEEDIKNWHNTSQVKESKEKQQTNHSEPVGKQQVKEVKEEHHDSKHQRHDTSDKQVKHEKFTKPENRPANNIEKKAHQPFKIAFENPNEDIDRELALRQSVSQGLVRQSNDAKEAQAIKQEKKDQQARTDKKGVTQESISELRSALKDLLKESGVVLNQPQTTKSPGIISEVVQSETSQPEPIKEQTVHTQIPPVQVTVNNITATTSQSIVATTDSVQKTTVPQEKQSDTVQKDNSPEQPRKEIPTPTEPKESKPDEIPESELRRLLEIE